MGRRKLKIQRLETMKARQATYSKRKTRIVKKAKEISVLCDVDVALLMFSPTDKPTLFVGQEKGLSAVLERLSKLPFEEREESSPQDASDNPLKLYEEQLRELRERLAEKSKILSDWKDPNNVEDLAQLNLMEEHLIASLGGIRKKKGQFAMELQTRERGAEMDLQ
ncbi:hypothetical protein V6N11_049530 [Hibiscus sabdariffa]|uniref:MADS-box domain-containing protein n=1 Tax=Hibiscus sabdariffa TaxID=183260 RepID=A0ABR2NAI0_9ROSI